MVPVVFWGHMPLAGYLCCLQNSFESPAFSARFVPSVVWDVRNGNIAVLFNEPFLVSSKLVKAFWILALEGKWNQVLEFLIQNSGVEKNTTEKAKLFGRRHSPCTSNNLNFAFTLSNNSFLCTNHWDSYSVGIECLRYVVFPFVAGGFFQLFPCFTSNSSKFPV